ncbi:MAG: 3-keto-disaccharide hydrolase [Flavobacteriaceae bacterium]
MRKIILSIAILSIWSCAESSKNKSSEWINLFDGSSLEGWRAYNGDQMPPGWKIVDGILTFTTAQILEQDYDYKGSRDIIYGAEEFDNFELYVEWKIPPGGNSGIFYHVKEGYQGPSLVSPEYQLIDDENYAKIHDLTSYNTQFGVLNPSDLQDWQKTAADYAMYVPDTTQKVLYPPGQWNSSRIVFTPNNVEHWLNGKKVLSFVPWSEDWYKKRNSGKWNNAPDYGKYKTGYIGFQDHGSNLSFRNIKIKKL